MAKKIKIDDLAKSIVKELEEYGSDITEVAEKAIDETAKEAVKNLKRANPPGSGEYASWKEYNASWGITKTKTDARYGRKATIHNKKKYQLAHLLEKGHALVRGGRKVGETRAFEHIKPVADNAEKELEERITKGIKNA